MQKLVRFKTQFIVLGMTIFFALLAFAMQSVTGGPSVTALSGEPGPYLQQVTPPDSENIATATEANCRYGATPLQADQVPWLTTLGVGWFLNFNATTAALPANGAEFVPVIRVRQDFVNGEYLSTYTVTPPLTNDGLGAIIDANPGRLWLVGNEPDVGNQVQDSTHPDVYARIYREVYTFIKARDPSAQVGIAGLSMATPGRLQYLDIVWNTYRQRYGHPMPVDVWNIHLYILSEKQFSNNNPGDGGIALGTNPALAKLASEGIASRCPLPQVYCRAEHDSLPIFAEQIVAMRSWMKAHGQQNKPLILSEYSLLYPYVIDPGGTCFLQDENGNCFTPARVNAFMNATFNYLETATDPNLGHPGDNYRLVQQWMWYTLVTEPEASGGSSNLLKQNYTAFAPGSANAFTEIGQNFYNQVLSKTRYSNLKVGTAASAVAFTAGSGSTANVTLTVTFYNNGNVNITQPFNVTFYRDAARTQVIGTTTVNPVLSGCARREYKASVVWSGLSTGTRTYWVEIDSNNALPESNADNVASGTVLVNPKSSSYLPFVGR